MPQDAPAPVIIHTDGSCLSNPGRGLTSRTHRYGLSPVLAHPAAFNGSYNGKG